MDPFTQLPQELRLLVLESLSVFPEAIALSHASPIIYREFQVHKASICGRYVRRYFDDDLIQDAVAIITFPEAPEKLDKDDYQRKVFQHLHQWGRKGISDPTKSAMGDSSLVFPLHSLCNWVLLYVDDFLSKATSDFLPRAYRRLPNWCPFSKRQTQQELQQAKCFDRSILTWDQQRQILKSFLRYELLCRIYGPLGRDIRFVKSNNRYWRNISLEANRLDTLKFDNKEPFRYWDWAILNKVEGTDTHSSEFKLLPCIREYIITLYEACFADQMEADIPEITSNVGHSQFENAPLANRDNFLDEKKEGEVHQYLRLWEDSIFHLLASGGLDILTSALTRGIEKRHIFYLIDDMNDFMPYNHLTNPNISIYGTSASTIPLDYADSFTRLYRQRAWPLFAGKRPGPSLPSEQEYSQIYGEGAYGGRVPWGLKGDDTRNESIWHGGGIWTSRGLENLRGRFWNINPFQAFMEKDEFIIGLDYRPNARQPGWWDYDTHQFHFAN